MHRLRAALPSSRLVPYDSACAGTGVDPIVLYRWASSVSLAVFDDLAVVEVVMRSAMARELSVAYGLDWYRREDLLDDGTLRLVRDALRSARVDEVVMPVEATHSKLVASLMFGFWVKVLGRGAYYGNPPLRQRRVYDTTLWKPALRQAFPNAGDLDRAAVEAAARKIQALRNRIAHHEHIVWGIPLPGEKRSDGSSVRLSVGTAHDTLLALAGYVDSDIEGWLRDFSIVPDRLASCPLRDRSALLL